MATREETESALRAVRLRAEHRLSILDEERRQIALLLEFIDGYAGERQTPNRQRNNAKTDQVLLGLIADNPGIRGSMLAMLMDKSTAATRELLERSLEADLVERAGLGWRLAGRGRSTARRGGFSEAA